MNTSYYVLRKTENAVLRNCCVADIRKDNEIMECCVEGLINGAQVSGYDGTFNVFQSGLGTCCFEGKLDG